MPQSWFDQFREVDEPPPRVAGTSWFDQFREVDAPTTYDDEFGWPAVPSSRVVGPRKARALGSEPDVRARRGWPEPPALAPLESRPLVPSSLLSPVVLPTLAPRRVGPMPPQTGQARRSDDQADVVGRSDRDPPTIPNRAIRYRAAKRPPPEADRPPSPADQEFGTPRIPQPRDGTDGSRIRDLGISLAKGLITVPDAALGLSDIFMTGGFAGQGAETLGFRPTEWKATLDTYYSDQQQRANRSVQEADGLIEKATAALTHPSTIAHAVIESLPLMAAGGAVGRVVSTAMRPFMAGAVGEGIVSAGASAAEIRQQSETGRLTPGQRAVAGTSGTLTGALGALGGRIAERLGVVDVNTLLAAGLTDPVAYQNLFRAIVFGAFQEGVLEELPQSVQEQVLQNAATDRPLWEHVDTAAVMGTLAGAVMGGGAQVAALAGPRTTAPETGVDEPAPGTPPGDVPVSEAPPPSGRPAPAAQPTSWFDQFQEAGDIPLDAPPPPSPGARVDEEIESARPLPGTETPAAPARHDYSSTQVTLPPTERADIARLANTIPNEDLAEKGREAEPHITVKYGLHSRPDALATLQEILRDEPPVTVTFGKTAIFPDSGDGDVVKVDIESPDLRRLHKKIADALPNTETHGDYTPHATVAYVQPGLGKKYVGRTDLEGRQVTFDQMLFAGTDDTKTSIPLPGRGGPSPAAIDPPDAGEARKSVRTPQVTREALEQSETRELRRIAAELEAFPFAGKTYREAGPRRGGDLEVQGRTPGAAVYWDIVGGTPESGRRVFRYSRGQVAEKLQAFLRDGTRSVVSDLAVDVARRRLRGDTTVRTPDLPPEAGDPLPGVGGQARATRDPTQPTTRRRLPLVLTKNPAGTWSFGGSVPKDLAYANRATGAPISDEDAAQIAQHGPGLFRARIRSLTWPSEADALAAARVLGIDEVDGYDGKTIPTAPRESPSVEPQIAGQPPTAVGWSQEVPDGRTDRDRPGRRDERRRRTSVPDRTASPGALGAVPAEPRAPAAPAEREGPTPGDSERVPSDGVRDRPDTGTQPGAAPVTDRGTVPRRALSPSGAVGDAGPVPPDYRLTSDRVRAIVSRGSITRVRDNLAALDTVKAILADRRYATPDEQDVLAKYVGWGDSAVAAFLDSHPRRTWTPSETRVWQAVQDATTAEERAALIRSAPNAHFTYDLYAPIWQALERYGFTGGRVLEPAVGTGHAFGVMPAQMQQASTLSAVELEPMTAAIAQALYPSARVQPVGYEEARIPRNTQDLVISNVPFGDFGVRDRRFPALLTKRIHNYFFANALEHVRPGGLVAFITSRYTMDAQATAKVRRYLMDRAHFLGAVRLPNTAFKQSAKTEVVTDLILLQKHQEGEARRPEADRFVATEEVPALSRTDASGRRVPVVRSAWYTAHPTLILGTESLEGSQYGSHEYTVTAKTRSVTDALGRALATLLPDGAYQPATTAATTTRPEPAVVEGVFKPGELRVVDDTVVRVTPDGETVAMDVSKAAAARVRGMVAIRDALRATVAAMRDPETSNADIRARQQALTTAYADFSKQYGTLNSRTNRGLFRDDPEAANLLGLEVLTPKSRLTQDARGKKILRVTHDVTGLADIFTTRTIRAETEVTHVDTPHDALLASLGTTTHIDWPYMSRISGQSVEALQASLRSDGRVFEQPDGSWVTADEYLSGDVKTKLADAEAAAADEPTRFTANVTALTTVQPSDKTFEDITIALGSHWVPPSDVDAFIQDELQVASGQLTTKLSATETVVHWTVEVSWTAEKAGDGHRLAVRYGPGDRYAYGLTDMLHDALNLRTPSLGWWEGSGDTRRYVKALEATQAARGNVEELRRAWTAWVYDQPEVQQRLVDTYNERFNRTVRRVYDGGHLQDSLTRHGLALPFDLYPHQLNAIWRTLSSGNTLLAHEVGAGKTFEMIVTAMEMRRTGRARKPLITVPTHLLSQWRADILKAYPAARVLAFDETDLAARKRQQAMARIAFGDWDIVLVPHSSFQLLKVSDARLITVMQDWVDELRDAEAAAQADGDRDSVKQMERKRRQIEDKVANKTKSLNRGQDNALTWEDLGVDALFVDEAHVFKNLFFFSKLDNLRGLSRSEADRSLDLYVKVQDINEQSNYRNLTLATATPVMNSMAELFTMQRYLQPHRLRQLGVDHFDNWYAMFGQALPTHEQRPDGSYHEVMRLRAFKNLDALYRTVTEVMDYVGWQDMPYLKLPTLKGNRVTVVQTDPHPMYETLRRWFEQRLAALRVTPPHVDRNTGKYIAPERLHPLTGVGMNKPDNILTVMNDAKAAAIDVRLVLGDAASDVPHSRVQTAARDLVTIYRAEATTKGVVLVFLDHGTPRDPPPLEFLSGVTIADQTAGVPLGTEADLDPGQVVGELEGEFNLYEALKAALVGHGVPSHEIAFIHQAKRAAERLALFDAANEGRIRVLVASTDKGGVGMNIQRRLAAIAHIDAPRAQRPGDLRQRDGRGIRQGNTYDEIDIRRYVTKGTTDEWLYGMLNQKATLINQFMRGDATEFHDDDPSTMSIEEAQIRATGDPRGIELTELRSSLARLTAQAAAAERAQAAAKASRAREERRRDEHDANLAAMETWIDRHAHNLTGDRFVMRVGATEYTGRKRANAAIRRVAAQVFSTREDRPVGQLGGLDVTATWSGIRQAVVVHLAHPTNGGTMLAATLEGAAGHIGEGRDVVRSLLNRYHAFREEPDTHRRAMREASEALARARRTLERPVDAVEKARAAQARIAALEAELTAESHAKDAALDQARRAQTAARADTTDEPPPTGGGSGAANVGTFAPTRPGRATTTPARPETIHPIEFPELVDLARRLQRTPKVVRAFRKAGKVGEFRPGSIRLAADLFKTGQEQQLAKTLAHEIGHLIDWLPTPTLKRGNILGRLRSLRSYLRGTFTGPDGTTIKNTAIRDELKALSATWRPWNRATSPARFREYRDSARELYADAVSVLLNDPELLTRDAPQFAQAFFDGLDRKPDVRQAYFDLQEQLSGTRVELVEKRRAGVRRMWHEGNVKALELEQLRQRQTTERRHHLWFRLRHELLDKHTTFLDRVHALEQRGVTINPDDDPRYLLSERNYLGGKLKGFVEEQFAPIHQEILESGVGWATFGELLFYDRILAGDRSELANPKGLSPADATELRDRVIADLGPERARVATAAADRFRAVVKDVATQAHEAGLYTDELFKQMQTNPAYVTFQVIDHLEDGVTSRVYRQIGTLKWIAHPADATVLKTLVTLRAIEHNRVKHTAIRFLHQHHPEDIENAKTVGSGRGRRPIESKDPDTHLVRYFKGGRLVGVYVDQYIADALENNSVGQNLMVIQLLQMVNGRYFRPVFTTFNLGFQTFNLARDVGRFWKATPQLRGTGIGDTLLRYWQAVPMAKVRAFGLSARPSAKELAAYRDLIDSEKAGILSITYNDFILGRETEDTQMEDVLARLGVTTFTPKPRRMVFRPFIQMLDTIKEVGDFIETIPKGAGIHHFRGDGEIADISPQDRAFIRERMGSPDFLAGGTAKAAMNNLLLFSNAIFQGVRADLKTATEPRTRAGFWWKTATVNLLPKAVMFLALAGLLGPDLKRLFQKVSEYDRTNYIPVPVGVDAHDNVIYIRIPQDDMGRLIGGLFWKALQVARDDDVFSSLGQLADYSAGQFPSVAPVFEAGLSTVQFVSGRNPYDAFRGRYVFTEDEFKARDWRTVKKFIGWQFQQLGGGIVWKFYPGEQRPRERTPAQKVLELPVVSNVIGRFVRITNYGEIEAFRGAQRQAARGEAQRRLTENEGINDAIRAYLELPADRQTVDERNTLARQLTRALYDSPRERADRENPIRTKLRIGILRGEADPLVDTLLSAGSNTEKVAILDAAQDTMAEDAFEAWLGMAVDQRIISRDVRADVLRRADARAAVEAGAGR